ncbi:MAG: phosphomannose isomerase type II C-terminal cupin domain [Pseudomonadota bacterium]
MSGSQRTSVAGTVRYETGDRDERPWGSWEVIATGPRHTVKQLIIQPGKRHSLQFHNHRSEHWIVVAGTGEIELDDKRVRVGYGDHVLIETGMRHRLTCTGTQPMTLIEVQIGDVLDEADIIRVEDDFGRAS